MTSRLYKPSLSSPCEVGRTLKFVSLLLLFSLLLGGCYQPVSSAIPKFTPQQATSTAPVASPSPVAPTISPTVPIPLPSPTIPPYTVWLPAYLPEKLSASINLPADIGLASSPESADFSVAVSDQLNDSSSTWIYCLVAPFPTVTDGLSSDEFRSIWSGDGAAPFDSAPLLMDESTYDVLSVHFGAPLSQQLKVMSADQLLEAAWANQPSLAIVPFESLEPRWKVLSIDGQSPIHKDFDPNSYLLSISFALSGDSNPVSDQIHLPATNRDPSKMTTVAMTGVTAMVRATAYAMELEGITYPAQDIGSLLASADITHISNEIPFSPDCPYPTPTMENLVFCSRPSYIDLLKAVGTDVIELTGDHFMDHGADATLYTLQMYQELGWPYYGGGANAEEARQPVKFENNGNRIAFMGCNVGCEVKPSIPCDAIATDEHPGAAQCDYDYISNEIPALKNDGYQVIFTFQHNEYYTYTTEPDLYTDFGQVAAYGASIVSGSQAHQPHGFSFQAGAFIHYGLGNLFFDQYHYCYRDECDEAFIDQHVFYDGKYISTQLITIKFVDYARPRLMTPEERAGFLELIFSYSDW
jgi:hypothetical protein